jgi:uncharacterized membrane protein YhhN
VTTAAWTFAALAAVLAVADWWAVWADRRSVRPLTKPGALVALIGVAVALEPFDPGVRRWMVLGLVLSLAGDVFLLGSERWFVGGLASFLLGHVAYVIAMQTQFDSPAGLLVGLVAVAVAVAVVARRLVAAVAAGGHRELVGPVVAYVAVISAMVVSAFGTAAPWAIGGALLFYVSDATLAWNRFLEPRRLGPVAVMITYHLAQAGLVGWLVTG